MASLFALALCLFVGAAQSQVVSTRIWPAKDYTRVTIESKNELKYTLFALKNPERLVLDFEGEPKRTLSDRRRKGTVIRDLASMIGSFDRAALGALCERWRKPACRLDDLR